MITTSSIQYYLQYYFRDLAHDTDSFLLYYRVLINFFQQKT